MQKNRLIRKLKLISIFVTSHTGQQIPALDILPDILKSKVNQTMKLGQLIEYDMRDIFLEKSSTKSGGEANHQTLF